MYLVGLELFLVKLGVVMFLKDFVSHGVAHISLGEYPLGENWDDGVAIPSSIHPILGGSSLEIVFV